MRYHVTSFGCRPHPMKLCRIHRPTQDSRTLFCLRFSSKFGDLGILPYAERKMSNSLAYWCFHQKYVVKYVKEICETVHSTPKETCDKATPFKQQKARMSHSRMSHPVLRSEQVLLYHRMSHSRMSHSRMSRSQMSHSRMSHSRMSHSVLRSEQVLLYHRMSRLLRGGGLGSRPKKLYGERLGDGVECHLMSPTPRR